jgi:hypothetical protein
MTPVRKIEFFDYKAFSHFTLSARTRNIIVGPNNAGKSTLLDAFRIALDALKYARRHSAVRKSHGSDGVCSTYFVPESVVQTDLRACVHNFDDGHARIQITLDNLSIFTLKIPNGGQIECYLKSDEAAQTAAKYLRDKFPLDLVVVPTLSPLEQNEEKVTEETVEKNQFSRLASRNFRNYWLHQSDEVFDEFSELVALGWPGVRIKRPEIDRSDGRPFVRMFFRQGPDVREIQWAGFGFQVWMQTMTHLRRANRSSVLVLDEPDVYLHPDLQHRLMRIVNERVGQVFVATHSTEIINGADPGDVVIVRPESRSAKRIQNDSDYPEIYRAIGSSENAQFARLARTKKVLYFEGNDARLLAKFAKKFGGADFIEASSLTLMKTDGFSNWTRVTNSSWVFKNFFGFDIPVAALFDRDYRCEGDIADFLSAVNTTDTMCRVLPFKEIENVLLSPRAVAATIMKQAVKSDIALVRGWVDQTIASASEGLKTKVLSNLIGARSEWETRNGRAKNLGSISAEVEKTFSRDWANLERRLLIMPGKEFFSLLAAAVQSEFKVTLTISRVVDELDASEICPEFLASLLEIRAHLGL